MEASTGLVKDIIAAAEDVLDHGSPFRGETCILAFMLLRRGQIDLAIRVMEDVGQIEEYPDDLPCDPDLALLERTQHCLGEAERVQWGRCLAQASTVPSGLSFRAIETALRLRLQN